jgi:plasmid stabilization system protein ParE
MVAKQAQVVWTKRSQRQMKSAFDYIYQDSPHGANKVLEDIAAQVVKAASNPEMYSLDKYKINNDGTYRAFDKHRYRVSYRYSNNIIRVLRVRHTSMRPLNY